jgi:hypothetical protein
MKKAKIVLPTMICFVLGCSGPEFVEDSGPVVGSSGFAGGGGSYPSVATQTIPATTIQSGAMSIFNSVRNDPNSWYVTTRGINYIQGRNVTGSSAFNLLNKMKILNASPVPWTWDQARAEIVSKMNQWNTPSSLFKSMALNTFDHIRANIDAMTFQQFESYMNLRLDQVANPITRPGSPTLSANEKFALTQAFTLYLNFVKSHAHVTSIGCDPNWRDIAKDGIQGGLAAGFALGLEGAFEGALATGGNPVGAVVGGFVGFTLGFSYATIGSGLASLISDCMVQIMFPVRPYTNCPDIGKIWSYGANPSFPSNCYQPTGVDLRDVLQIGLVPNKGSSSLNTQVVNDINMLLSYL